MVFVAFDHVFTSVKKRLFPLLFLREAVLLIALRMRFVVSLVDDVDAIFVAQFVPINIIRIMAGAHGVDVVFEHYLNIQLHSLPIDVLSGCSAVFVTVHALHHDRFSVNLKQSVLNLNGAESYIRDNLLHFGAFVVFNLYRQGVEIRLLSRPWLNACNHRLIESHSI